MKKITIVLAVIGMVFGFGGLSFAADNCNQTVNVEVSAINEVSVSGNIAAMEVSTATAGSDPDPVDDTTTTLSFTTNDITVTKHLNAQLGADMPAGVVLNLEIADPGAAWAPVVGGIALADAAADIATGTAGIAAEDIPLTYTLSATAVAGVKAAADKTVTFTLADS
jgi:hypothetical protein